MIEPTDEMKAAVKKRMGVPDGQEMDPWMDAAIKDVLAIVERDRPRPAQVLMDAAATARGIADRLAANPGNGKIWPAMSAGARLVAVRLVELADDADGNGYSP